MPPRTRSQKADLEERGLTASPLQQLPDTTRVRRQPRTRTNKSNSLPPKRRAQTSQNSESQPKTTSAQQQQLEENIENATFIGRGSDPPKDSCESPSSLIQVAHPVQDNRESPSSPTPVAHPVQDDGESPSSPAPIAHPVQDNRESPRSPTPIAHPAQGNLESPISPTPIAHSVRDDLESPSSLAQVAHPVEDSRENPSSPTKVAHPVQDPFPSPSTLQKAAGAPERPFSVEAALAAKDEDQSTDVPFDAPFNIPSASLQQAQSEPSDVKLPNTREMPYAPINVESALQDAPHAMIHMCLKAPAMSNLELEYPAAKPDAVFMVPTKYLDWVSDQISNVPGAFVLRNPLTMYHTDPVIGPQASLGTKKRKADGDVEMLPPAQRPRLNQSIVRERLRRQINRERLSKPRADQVFRDDLPIEPLGPGVGAVRPRFVIDEYDKGGEVELGLASPIHESETADMYNDNALQSARGSGSASQPPQPLASFNPSANVSDDSMNVHPPPSDHVSMPGPLPQTPSRSWGLGSILDTARSITRFFPGRRNNDSPTATAGQGNQARLAAAPSGFSNAPQTEPRQVQPLTEIANAPATTQPSRGLHDEDSDYPKLMRTKKALRSLKNHKALQNELREQLKQIEKEKEWMEKERRDLDRAHRAAYEAQKPGDKRVRLPSPEMIPRAEDGGFTTDSNYFAYDSSDDERSPSKSRPKKVRRVSKSDPLKPPLASISKPGELNQPLPYTGRHFSGMKGNTFRTSKSGSFLREMEKKRKAEERKAAKMAEAEKRGPKPSFCVPGWGIGGDTSSSEDESEEEDSEESTIIASKSNPTPPVTTNKSLSGTPATEKMARLISKSASRPEATPKDHPQPSSTQIVPSALATQAPLATPTVQAPATVPVSKTQNTWTQPPPPPPNPSHAALPSTSSIVEPDSIRIQRAKFQKPPTKPSSLRYSSRVSTSTVGSDDGDEESGDQDDRAAKEPATAAEVNQPLGPEREKTDETLVHPLAQIDTPSPTPPAQGGPHAQTPTKEGPRSDISELGKDTSLIPTAYEEFKENMEPKVLEFLESNWDQMDEVFAHEDFSRLLSERSATTQIGETGNGAEESLFLPVGPTPSAIEPTSVDASLGSTGQLHTEEGVMDEVVQKYLDEMWTQEDEAWAINDFRQGVEAFKKNMSAVNQLA
ncbi:MAG: hypothetical protein LQ351_006585 [Letrouitia transgressa]|nr:MAG: hypothetical protein LQ351_006585 [Letrouitia transgressa]